MPVYAVLGGLQTTRSRIGYNQGDIFVIGGSVGAVALSFLGIVFLILIFIGGYMWMTAAGNKTRASGARKLIVAALLGLIIVASAYAISGWLADTFAKPLIN